MTVTVDVEDKSVQKPPVIIQEVLLYYEKQTVPRFSAALAVKNKTPFDMILLQLPETTNMILKVFVSELKKFIFLKVHLYTVNFQFLNCIFKILQIVL